MNPPTSQRNQIDMNADKTIAANLLLLEAERQIEQLAKKVLALEAENQRLKQAIRDISETLTKN